MTLHRISPLGDMHIYACPEDGMTFRIDMTDGLSVKDTEATAYRLDENGEVWGGPVAKGWGVSAYADCLRSLEEFVSADRKVRAT